MRQRRLAPATRAHIAASLQRDGWPGAAPFVEAVTLQVAHPVGGEPVSDERPVADAVLELVREAGRGEAATGAAARRLAADEVLHAAFFQNLDLLASDRPAHADAVALLVVRALEEPTR